MHLTNFEKLFRIIQSSRVGQKKTANHAFEVVRNKLCFVFAVRYFEVLAYDISFFLSNKKTSFKMCKSLIEKVVGPFSFSNLMIHETAYVYFNLN